VSAKKAHIIGEPVLKPEGGAMSLVIYSSRSNVDVFLVKASEPYLWAGLDCLIRLLVRQ